MNTYSLKLALRNLLRYRLSSFISILGLTIGFAAFILIMLFLNYEYSWDKQNENYDSVYRIQRKLTTEADVSPSSNPILKDLLLSRYPEIDKMVLIHLASDEQKTIGEFLASSPARTFNEFEGIYAEQAIFDIYTYQFIEGSKARSLVDPYAIVLSKALANKLFPGRSALGELVILNKKFNLKVTGVYEDLPFNSHLRPSYIISLPTIEKTKNITNYRKSWRGDFYVYVLLKKGNDYRLLNEKIKYITAEFNVNNNTRIFLHPLSQLYVRPNDNPGYGIALAIFKLIAVFILLIASFNYINLATAISVLRAKEIAIQKVNGIGRDKIILQFLGESVIISLIALIFALFLAELCLPVFSKLVVSDLKLSYIKDWSFILKMMAVAVMVGLFSGIYPALVMSRYNAVELFHNFDFNGKSDGQMLKKILVSAQFLICIVLIVFSLTFSRQIKYMMTKDLGFDKENMLVTKFEVSKNHGNFNVLKERLLNYPEITDVCYADKLPFGGNSGWPKNWEGGEVDEKENDNFYFVSADFIKTMKMKIVEGRDFSPQFPADSGKAVIINETAVKRFGWSDPIGKKVDDNKLIVVGVVKDFHPYGVHNLIRNCMLMLDKNPLRGGVAFAFRVTPGNMRKAKEILTKELEAFFPDDAFEIIRYVDFINSDEGYKKFHTVYHTISLFTILNILLAVIGLMGLIAFTTQQKSKEMAIRKINGCSSIHILLILNRQYVGLILIASIFAWPFAWYLNAMLPIAYRSPEKIYLYVIATVYLIVICFITSLFYTVKAALRNPVEALRYE